MAPHKNPQINPERPTKAKAQIKNGKKSYLSKQKNNPRHSSSSSKVLSHKIKRSNLVAKNLWCNKLPKTADNSSNNKNTKRLLNSWAKPSWPFSSLPKTMPWPSKNKSWSRWWLKLFCQPTTILPFVTWNLKIFSLLFHSPTRSWLKMMLMSRPGTEGRWPQRKWRIQSRPLKIFK